MSWCRWGSPCSFTIPMNEGCSMGSDCPGSSLYIYESADDCIVCCACPLNPDPKGEFNGCADWTCKTEEEMEQHCRDHVAAGHHVRPGLYDREFQDRQIAARKADIEKYGEWGAITRWATQGMMASDEHAKKVAPQVEAFWSIIQKKAER